MKIDKSEFKDLDLWNTSLEESLKSLQNLYRGTNPRSECTPRSTFFEDIEDSSSEVSHKPCSMSLTAVIFCSMQRELKIEISIFNCRCSNLKWSCDAKKHNKVKPRPFFRKISFCIYFYSNKNADNILACSDH